MYVVDSLVSNPAWLVYLGNVAVASLAVYAVALLAERLARHRALPLRHLLLVCGLGCALAAPLILGVLTLTRLAPFEFVATSANATSEVPVARSALPEVAPPIWREEAPVAPAARTRIADQHAPAAAPAAERTLTDSAAVASERALAPPAESVSFGQVLRIGGATLVLVWLLGSVYQVVLFLRGLAGVHRLLKLVEPVSDPRIQRIATEAARSLGMRSCPRLSQSTSLDAPVSIGLLRGQIVLPASQVIEWPDQAWRALLVHELAHVKRSDLQIGLLQRVALILYWWNPLTRRTSAQIASLREQICDDLVTQHGTHDDGYAALILELASRVAGRGGVATALGAAECSSGELTERVHRLLEPERKLVTSLSGWQTAAVAAFGAALLLATGGTTVRWAVAAEPPKAAEPAKADVPAAESPQDAGEPVLSLLTNAEQDKPRQKRVRVVDLTGEPVAGATVSVWAFHSAQGHGLWTKGQKFLDDPPTVTTDAEGRATIPFPKYGNPIEKIPMDMLTCVVKHPEFATTRYNEVNVRPETLSEESVIQIAPGARVTIRPTAEGDELDRQRLFVTWSSPTDSYDVRKMNDGGLELPRLSAGPELLRVVYLPEKGAAMFSDVIEQELTDGADLRLDVELHPSVTVVGMVDPSVPRPIQNGIVSAMAIDSTGKVLNKLSWRTAADIDAEGNFRLEDLPAGSELQVIALCDGYMATSGDAPPSVPEKERKLSRSQSAPQVFRVDEKINEITLAMTPTVECAISVVDQDSKPIQGAKIYFMPNIKWWNGGSQLYCHPRFTMKDILLDKERRSVRAGEQQASPFEAISGADGVAVVRNLPPNLNRFVIGADGYEMPITGTSRTRSVDLSEGRRHELTVVLQPKSATRLGDLSQAEVEASQITPTQATQIVKPAAPVKKEITSKPTELTGIVVDESGKPLADVTVDAWTWYAGNETKTDAEGRFRLSGFERSEPVEIEFTKEGYSPSLFVEQKAGTPDWVVVLTQGTAIEGRVLDPHGEPVPKALVRAWRGPFETPQADYDQVWTETTADEAGHYRLNLEPGIYTIEMRVNGVGALRLPDLAVEAKKIKPLDLQLESGVRLTALVRDAVTGEPVPGIVLWNFMQPGIEGTTNDQGLLEIPHMTAGEFRFWVGAGEGEQRKSELAGKYARWWSPQATKEWEREQKKPDNPLNLPADTPADERRQLERDARVDSTFQRNLDNLTFNLQGNTTAVEIFVEPAVTIQGRVVSPDDQPVAGATVAPAKTGSGNSLTGDTRYSVTTDAEGKFTMLAPAGKNFQYNLIAHDGAYQQWRTWANGATEPFETKPGEVIEGVEIRLTRGGTVRGVVRDSAGKPKVNVEVRAAAVDQRDHRYYVPSTRTDAEGRYELKLVSPGKQQIQAGQYWTPTNGPSSEWTRNVDIEDGRVLDGIDLRLPPGTSM